MSKSEEIKAYSEFLDKIQKITAKGHGTYFDDLLFTFPKVEQNIKNDFPWAIGLFIKEDALHATNAKWEDVVTTMKERIDFLETKVKDCQKYDIRELVKEKMELVNHNSDLQDNIYQNNARIAEIKDMMEGI